MKKIGIVCASDEELEPFLSCIENSIVTKKAMLKVYEGRICGISVAMLYSGVGKVNAAIASQVLINKYDVDMIINAGCAGGMDESIELFDIIISSEVAYHDMTDDILTEFHPWVPSIYFPVDKSLLDIVKEMLNHREHVYLGRMVTGEKFIEDNDRESIKEKYKPLSVDMETTSIAHVCYVNEIPFISIRCITDTSFHIGIQNFEKNCKKASIISKDIVIEFIEELRKSSLHHIV